MLPPSVKIMQNFILMQNNSERDWIGGGEIFETLFSKKVSFFQKNAIFGQYWTLPSYEGVHLVKKALLKWHRYISPKMDMFSKVYNRFYFL